MCGICGYLAREKLKSGSELLRNMGQTIAHRGPDDMGFYEEDEIGLCHRRLSILDLSSKGHQPMQYSERYIIVFNGEIYNYVEIRDKLKEVGYVFCTSTDTEVILAAYAHWGKKCVEYFNGMWAFAIWDSEEKELFCARDRFGVKPFYYHINEERFLFASEIKALIKDVNIERIANEPIVYDYLTQGLLEHTDETFFTGIYKLPAGSYATIDKELNISIVKYYDVCFSEQTKGKISEEDQKVFRDLFEQSVRFRLRADVPVGSCLSGGLDSSAIVCCMDDILKKQKSDVLQHTFSYCTTDKRIDERKYMKAVENSTDVIPHQIFSKVSGLKNELEDLIYFQDEPFSSTGMYASYCVYRAAKENNIKVLLDGQGADEILCGYRKSRVYYVRSLLREKRFIKGFLELMGSVTQIRQSMFLKNDIFKLKKILFKKEVINKRDFLRKDFKEKVKGFDYSRANNFQHNDVFVVSLPALLRYADRNSMAFSVESRLPFLDVNFVEYCAALPLGKKMHKGWSKYIMRKSLLLPSIIKKRKDKIGFATPEDIWLKTEREYFKKIFENENIRSKDFVDTDQLLNNWDEILDKDNGTGLFRYICLELWMQKFDVKTKRK